MLLLRNILKPSAARASAYRTYRVILTDDSVIAALLVNEADDAIIVRKDMRSAG